MGNEFDYIWNINIAAQETKVLTYSLTFVEENDIQKMPDIIVEGMEQELVTGAKTVKGL